MMKEKVQNTDMLYRQMIHLLPVQVLLCAVGAVNGIVSSYFAANYIGIDAMSAVGLYNPISLLITSTSTVFHIGTSILCGKYMGRNQLDDLRRCFSLDMLLAGLLSLAFSVLFALLAFFDLTGFITQDESVRLLFNRYLLGQAIGVFPFVIGSQLSMFLSLENKQKWTLVASLIFILVNLFFNALFVKAMHLQAFGLAIASSLGMWVFFGVQALYFLLGKSPLRFSLKGLSLREGREILKTGFPGALSSWYLTVRGQIVNLLLLTYVGSIGISAFAAANNLLNLFWAIPAGMLNVSRFLMSISIGEEDRRTLTDTMRGVFRLYIPLMCAVSALLIAAAIPFTRILFHDPSEPVFHMTVLGFRILPLCMPFSIVCAHFICYGQISGKPFLVHSLSLLDGVVCVSVFSAILIPFLGIVGVYSANVINGIITLLFIIAYAWWKKKYFPRSVEDLMVIPESFGVSEAERMELRVRTNDEVVLVSENVVAFCKERGIDSRRACLSGLFLEEMAGNVVQHGFPLDQKAHTVDIRVVHKGKDVILRIKDDCAPFDPQKRLMRVETGDRIQNIGIRIVFGLAKEAQYQNTLGLNVFTVRI